MALMIVLCLVVFFISVVCFCVFFLLLGSLLWFVVSFFFFLFVFVFFFFFQAEDGIRDHCVTGVQTCALPISGFPRSGPPDRSDRCEQGDAYDAPIGRGTAAEGPFGKRLGSPELVDRSQRGARPPCAIRRLHGGNPVRDPPLVHQRAGWRGGAFSAMLSVPMIRRLAVIAPLLALTPAAPAAPAQQLDTTLWARLRYRFVGPEGNRTVAVVGEPGNPLVAYVGAASGGIWKTEDGGVHWQAAFDSEPVQAIGALAMASSAHNVLWAGTGETFFIRSTTALGNGVYRSTDGGRSWLHLGLEGTGRIARIVIHPADPDVVLVCALG